MKDDLLQGISLEDRKRESFDGLKAMFVGESQEKPIVVILEDIHWIDKISEEFFDYLSASVPKNRLLVLALHRPEYRCPWGTSSSYLRIPVEPLSPAESDEMIHRVLEVPEVGREVKELVQAKSEGNPFFLEELILELREAGWIRTEKNACRMVGAGAKAQVPATVQDVIMARIDRLADPLKHTLQLAAVIGREFPFAVLEKIADPAHQLEPSLQSLQHSELITEKNLFPELEYMFKNVLTQNVAYNSLLVQRRRELHTRVAAAIEELKRDSLEEHFEVLAHHYKSGNQPGKAFEFLARAGEKAMELHSVEVAESYYNDAIAIAAELDPSDAAREKGRELKSRLREIGTY